MAGKTGYENRMVTFNYWILPVTTPWNDCWAGESAGMIEVPEENRPQYGPAPGIRFHDLMIMEDDWGFWNRTGKIPDTLYTQAEMLEYIGRFRNSKSMLTINAEIYQEGFMGELTQKVLKQTAEAGKKAVP